MHFWIFQTQFKILKFEIWKGMQSPPTHLENSRSLFKIIIFTLPLPVVTLKDMDNWILLECQQLMNLRKEVTRLPRTLPVVTLKDMDNWTL